MKLNERGYYVDIYSQNERKQYRTFTGGADLAKYISNTKGPHVIIGGNSTQAKQEAAKIVRNTPTAIMKLGEPEGKRQWARVAETAVEVS